jgi:hypothetical protein
LRCQAFLYIRCTAYAEEEKKFAGYSKLCCAAELLLRCSRKKKKKISTCSTPLFPAFGCAATPLGFENECSLLLASKSKKQQPSKEVVLTYLLLTFLLLEQGLFVQVLLSFQLQKLEREEYLAPCRN